MRYALRGVRDFYHIAAAQQLYRICRQANILRPQSGHIAKRHKTGPCLANKKLPPVGGSFLFLAGIGRFLVSETKKIIDTDMMKLCQGN